MEQKSIELAYLWTLNIEDQDNFNLYINSLALDVPEEIKNVLYNPSHPKMLLHESAPDLIPKCSALVREIHNISKENNVGEYNLRIARIPYQDFLTYINHHCVSGWIGDPAFINCTYERGAGSKNIKPIGKQRRISELSKDVKSTIKILDGIAKEHSYRRVLEKIEEYGHIDSAIVIPPLKKLLFLFLTDGRFFQQ